MQWIRLITSGTAFTAMVLSAQVYAVDNKPKNEGVRPKPAATEKAGSSLAHQAVVGGSTHIAIPTPVEMEKKGRSR
ncbi:hypothetical protein ACFDAU_10250 [Sulfuriferula sp. GW1]|uniref:hypothetical protein n=1 Tax=Sulfuriferula sp. GW1 TaxID=3345111 RepID=UPI0039AF2136